MNETFSKLVKELQAIVGERNATDDPAICTSYSRDQHWHFVPAKNPACIVRPGNKEEVRAVLMLANTHKIPVIPYSTGINVRGLTIPVHDGSILLDLSRMNRILEINPEMKTATVEPGVTFGMLLEQTRKYKLRPAFPDAPLTVSVLVNYYLRGIYQTSATDGHDHTISYEMILPNGETLKTGSRALSEMPYFRYGVGPDFAGMFCAHPGTCGVVTELTAKLYRLYDNRKEYFIGFDDVGTPTKFIYNLMNDDLAASIRLVDNQSWLKGIFGTFDYPYEKLPKFVLCVLIEGVDGIYEAKDKLVRAYMKECGGQVLELPAEFARTFEDECLGGAEKSCMVFGIKGRGNYHCIGLYGPLTLAAEYYEVHEKTALEVGIPQDHIHFYIDPIYSFHGQLCYFELDVFYDGSDEEFGDKLRNYNEKQFHRLLDLGIYGWFRPYAGIIEPTAERIGYLAEVWKKFLHVLDPNEIMNRGKLF
ncbi:D-lactate dehydrogenase (acceptor) [ANME-1 cluster archaeon GoMg1]|nr:D-lactate dehydrogenase (acceptor) [ANME-1 cluster archaeon GoMg1]